MENDLDFALIEDEYFYQIGSNLFLRMKDSAILFYVTVLFIYYIFTEQQPIC